MARGFPNMLTEQILQLRLADAVNERGGGADEFPLNFKKQALQLRHVLHGGHATGRGGPGDRGGFHR